MIKIKEIFKVNILHLLYEHFLPILLDLTALVLLSNRNIIHVVPANEAIGGVSRN